MSKLTKHSPSLKVVADDVAAAKLRELLKDADDGFRRVVKVGLYIEWIAANLPHGQFMPWLAEHAPDVGQMTVYRWRSMAKNLCEWSGLKFTNLVNLTIPAENLLTLPVEKLPANLQKARWKMDEVLDSARTPKQLFLDIGFKQGELDAAGYPKAKVGRAKGSGGASKEQRAKARELEERATDEAIREKLLEIAEWLEAKSDDAGLGRPGVKDSDEHQQFDAAVKYYLGWRKNGGAA